MKKDLLPYFTVKVNEGSGCLFQPSCPDYSYVLTAKHVLNGSSLTIQRQTLDESGSLVIKDLEIIGEPYLHIDDNKDAAIIKIRPIEDIDRLIRDELSYDNNTYYYLCGHPEAREGNNYSFRENQLTLETRQQYGYIEAELSKSAIQSEVMGQSGGGIIKIEESCYLLAGIQKRMAVPDGQESLGRIMFMPLSFYDEIIVNNSIELSSLVPPYIVSFSRLIDNIFNLEGLISNRELIQNELKVIAQQLCDDFTPKKILEIIEDSFLAHNSNPSLINHKKLWVAFLELITINQLHIDNKLNYEELVSLQKKRKLLFIDTDVWTKKIEDIYRSDLSILEKGGKIIVCASKEKVPTRVELKEEELPVPDISVPIDEMNISNTITDPFKDLKLVNLFKFQHHIINNTLTYREANSTDVKKILKNDTKNIF